MVGLTNPLQVGQTVALQERNWGYQVTLLPPGQPGLKVVDMGPEHVAFEDEAGGVKTRLPAYLITAVTAAEATPEPVPVPVPPPQAA
jgi:hypothetical protein